MQAFKTIEIEKAVEAHVQKLVQRVARRLQNPDDLKWLLNPDPDLPYRPDYLTLGDAGKNRFQRLLNRTVSYALPRVWFRTFWPEIHGSLSSYTLDSYLPKLFSLLDFPDQQGQIQKIIMGSLDHTMTSYWPTMQQCTFSELSNCLLSIIHEPFKQLGFREDIFAPVKAEQNRKCLGILSRILEMMEDHPGRYEVMVYLCCRANWIDSLEDDATDFLERFENEAMTVVDRWMQNDINPVRNSRFFCTSELKKWIHEDAMTILIELDNCGEVVFDLWFADYLLALGHRCVLCVKSCAMVNDVTESDLGSLINHALFQNLSTALMDNRLQVVTSGSFIGGGKLPHEVSSSYRDAYTEADLVMVKGQGNFQSMPMGVLHKGKFRPYRYHNHLVFMTGVKAEMIRMCLDSLFTRGNGPQSGTALLYYFNPEKQDTWPI